MKMNRMNNIKRMIQKSILLIAALSLPIMNGSSQIGNQKQEVSLTSAIITLNLLDYASALKINAVNMENLYEAEPALENWMMDSDNWKSMKNSYGSLLTEETEVPLQIEGWMLEDFSTKAAENTLDETITEEKIGIESWMMHPETWGK
jgi:hypothetical protein